MLPELKESRGKPVVGGVHSWGLLRNHDLIVCRLLAVKLHETGLKDRAKSYFSSFSSLVDLTAVGKLKYVHYRHLLNFLRFRISFYTLLK